MPVRPVDNMAYYFTQGDQCLDVYEDQSSLILYDCYGYYQANQEFIWRRDFGMTSHLIYTTALQGTCLTIDGVSGQRPEESAPALLRPCDPNNTHAQWNYDFGQKRLTLTHYPDLCLDYHSAWNSHFAIYPCQHHALSFFGPDTQYNEIINIEPFNFRYDTTPRGPLVDYPQDNGTYLLTFGDFCLDYSISDDLIVLYKCNLGLNQEFQWRAAGDGLFQIFTASNGGKCLSIDGAATQRPANGANIVFRPCSETDVSQTWAYDSQRRVLHSGAFSDLCADFMDAGMMSSDHYIAYACKGPNEEPANQNINIEAMPSQYAPFVVDQLAGDYDLPVRIPTPGRSDLGVLSLGATAALASVAATAGLVFAARRGRRGAGARDAAGDLLAIDEALD